MKCSIITMFKNERHIINEWIDHHLSTGFDYIYLIDNGSTDDYKIDPSFEKYVSIYKEPKIIQKKVYNKYLKLIKKHTDWIAVIDIDEFIFSRKYPNNIKKILKQLPGNVYKIKMPMKLFCISSFHDPKS